MARSAEEILEQIADSVDKQNKAINDQIDAYTKLKNSSNQLSKSISSTDGLVGGITKLQKAAVAASVATTALVAAGSPQAFELLTGSARLVAIQLTNYLLPGILRTAAMAQAFARALEGLDQGTKDTITQFASAAAAAVLVGGAISFVVSRITPLGAAIGLLVLAFQNMDSVVSYLSEKWRQLTGTELPWEKRKREGDTREGDPENNFKKLDSDAWLRGERKLIHAPERVVNRRTGKQGIKKLSAHTR